MKARSDAPTAKSNATRAKSDETKAKSDATKHHNVIPYFYCYHTAYYIMIRSICLEGLLDTY
jgi:hypothetical protein